MTDGVFQGWIEQGADRAWALAIERGIDWVDVERTAGAAELAGDEIE